VRECHRLDLRPFRVKIVRNPRSADLPDAAGEQEENSELNANGGTVRKPEGFRTLWQVAVDEPFSSITRSAFRP